MRAAIYVAAVAATAACAPETGRMLLAGTAATLFEATPYLLAAVLLQRFLGRRSKAWLPFAGCGCGAGPAARSLPAALATLLLFGPCVAAARVAAATALAKVLPHGVRDAHDESFHDSLLRVTPSAFIASCATTLLSALHLGALPVAAQIFAGIALGFVAAPCALGAVAIAGALHAHSPVASAAFLCVSGIVDLRVWWTPHFPHPGDDWIAYLLVAAATAAVALRDGASLVHPHLAIALGIVAAGTFVSAFIRRREANPNARWVPAIMLLASVIGAPPPAYSATETTLADAFPGERIDFTGRLTQRGSSASVVRFAITCCRADAQPVAVMLAKVPNFRDGQWVHAIGELRESSGGLRLITHSISAVSPPLDPFVYR